MYVKITNGVPETYTLNQLRLDNPTTSFPRKISNAVLADFGVFGVVRGGIPTHDPLTQSVELLSIEQINGVWTQNWQVIDMHELLIRENMKSATCSPMQGILALGEARWQVILDYRNAVDANGNSTTPWAQKVIIDSAQDWRRDSENIAFFQYLLNLTDTEADDLFRLAMKISA